MFTEIEVVRAVILELVLYRTETIAAEHIIGDHSKPEKVWRYRDLGNPWYRDGTDVRSSAPDAVPITGNSSLTASFEPTAIRLTWVEKQSIRWGSCPILIHLAINGAFRLGEHGSSQEGPTTNQ